MKRYIFILSLIIVLVLGASAPSFATVNDFLNNGWSSSYNTLLPSYYTGMSGSWYNALLQQVYYDMRANQKIFDMFSEAIYQSGTNRNYLEAFLDYYTGSFKTTFNHISSTLDTINTYVSSITSTLGVKIDLSNTYLSNIQGYTSSAAQHAGNISGALGYSSSGTLKTGLDNIKSVIDNIYSKVNTESTDIGLIKSYLGLNGTYTLKYYLDDQKQSLNTIVNQGSDIASIKSGTDYIDDIAGDTQYIDNIYSDTSDIRTYSSGLYNLLSTPIFNGYSYVSRSSLDSTSNFNTMNTNKYYPVISLNNPDGRLTWNTVTINSNTDFISAIYNGILGLNNRLVTMGTSYNADVYTSEGAISNRNIYSIQDSLVSFGNNQSEILNDSRSILSSIYSKLNYVNSNVTYYFYNRVDSSPTSNPMRSSYRLSSVPYLFINSTNKVSVSNLVTGNNQNLFDYLSAINGNIALLDTLIYTPQTEYKSYYTSGSAIVSEYYAYSIADILDSIAYSTANSLSSIDYKLSQGFNLDNSVDSEQSIAVKNNFLGSGQASASGNDFTDLATGVANVKSGLNTGGNLSNIFGIFNNSDGYTFFSTDVLNEINTTSQSRGSDTPLYDQKIQDITSVMVIKNEFDDR